MDKFHVIDLLQILRRHVNTSKIICHSIYSYKTEYKIVTTVIDTFLIADLMGKNQQGLIFLTNKNRLFST